jgi:hypothetical protein
MPTEWREGKEKFERGHVGDDQLLRGTQECSIFFKGTQVKASRSGCCCIERREKAGIEVVDPEINRPSSIRDPIPSTSRRTCMHMQLQLLLHSADR